MKKLNKNNNKRGFTLIELFIELLIVIAIIGVLAAMAIPAFQKVRENNRKKIIEVEQTINSSFVVMEKTSINDFSVVKHKETGILYVCNYNVFTPLLDKDGKPLIKY